MQARLGPTREDGALVSRLAGCDLTVGDDRWPYMIDNAAAIERHWAARLAESPHFFNGRIFALASGAVAGEHFTGRLAAIDFKSFLHWRESGYPETGLRDAFGSALVRSAEGHVLLGRQKPGHVNSGLAYPPGGFIDVQDVAADGRVDVAASAARELAEETGLAAADFTRMPGFWLTRLGALVSFGAEFRSPLPTDALAAEWVRAMRTAADPELDGVVVIRSVADLDDSVSAFARALVRAVFAADPPAA